MQIEIKDVSAVYKAGKWNKIDLEYVRDGKTTKRTLVDIGASKPAFAVLKNAGAGESYDVTLVKDEESGYSNWVSAEVVESGAAKQTSKSGGFKSTYETPEERAKRNALESRRSALHAAVHIVGSPSYKGQVDGKEVAAVADAFLTWLYQLDEADAETKPAKPVKKKRVPSPDDEDFEDDLPFEE